MGEEVRALDIPKGATAEAYLCGPGKLLHSFDADSWSVAEDEDGRPIISEANHAITIRLAAASSDRIVASEAQSDHAPFVCIVAIINPQPKPKSKSHRSPV